MKTSEFAYRLLRFLSLKFYSACFFVVLRYLTAGDSTI